jgi:hypothetical protein
VAQAAENARSQRGANARPMTDAATKQSTLSMRLDALLRFARMGGFNAVKTVSILLKV